MLARIRDEAHRFAVTFHKKLRRRRTLRSALEDVPGVGQKRKRELLKTFGSLKKIREASAEELARAPGMSRAAAEAVAVRYFRGARQDFRRAAGAGRRSFAVRAGGRGRRLRRAGKHRRADCRNR